MNNFPLQQFALNLLAKNPNVANNPTMREAIDAIQRGDNVKGEQIANNICETYGVSREEATSRAKSFFHI